MGNRLGMTEEQMIYEIEFMRAWDEYLHNRIPDEYDFYSLQFAEEKARQTLKGMGANDDEVEDAVNRTNKAFGVSKE